MAYIFKSIVATQFLSNMLFIYFSVKCNIFKFHNCCSMYKWVMATLLLLLLKIWKITNILQTVRDRAILSEFLTHGVVQEYPCKREKFQFSSLLAAILDFSGKWKKCEYLENHKRAISSEFLTHRVLQEYPMQRGKFQFSPCLVANLDIWGKWSVNISKTVRVRAISSKILTHRVLQEYPLQRGKISIFATFGGYLGI